MGVLNVTPDSFSDGGLFLDPEVAIDRGLEMAADGADVIDIGGESTRPGSQRISAAQEIARIIPVISSLAEKLKIPISVDTTRPEVAQAALEAGAEIVNDISGLRFHPDLAFTIARARAGLVLMHSRGSFEELHRLPPVPDIIEDEIAELSRAIVMARAAGVPDESIALDPGIGFGKSVEQNLQLVAETDKLARAFPEFLLVIGTSRKSFIGKVLGGAGVDQREYGTMATVTAAVLGGVDIVRVHNVSAARDVVRIADAIKSRQAFN